MHGSVIASASHPRSSAVARALVSLQAIDVLEAQPIGFCTCTTDNEQRDLVKELVAFRDGDVGEDTMEMEEDADESESELLVGPADASHDDDDDGELVISAA